MLVVNTTDSIDVVLGANVTTNQLHIVASYNQTSSTAVTPTKNVTVTNNTTPVNLVPAPSSGNQHQLRWCSIFNSDSGPETVTVRYNYNGTTRIVISVVLQVNEYLQYTHRTGWKVFDINGALKNNPNFYAISDLKYPEYWLTTSATSTISIAGNTYGTYLGKATGTYTNIILNYVIITVASGLTWGEVAIYKGTPSLNTGVSLTRVGFVSQAQTWTSGTQVNKLTVVPCNGLVQPGDDLWVVIGANGGTGPAIRGPNIADDIGAGFMQTFSNNRPSTNATLTGTVSTTLNGLTIFWAGI